MSVILKGNAFIEALCSSRSQRAQVLLNGRFFHKPSPKPYIVRRQRFHKCDVPCWKPTPIGPYIFYQICTKNYSSTTKHPYTMLRRKLFHEAGHLCFLRLVYMPFQLPVVSGWSHDSLSKVRWFHLCCNS